MGKKVAEELHCGQCKVMHLGENDIYFPHSQKKIKEIDALGKTDSKMDSIVSPET